MSIRDLNNEESGREKRSKNRIQVTGKVSLSWTLHGREETSNGDVMDVSETGMRVRLHDGVPFGVVIRFRAESLKLYGTAMVLTCLQKGARCTVGIEFLDGLKWTKRAE